MDWISDGITRIRNAVMLNKASVEVRGTKIFVRILEILQQEGFIKGFSMNEEGTFKQACTVKLMYRDSQSVIRTLKRVSKPSLRVYATSDELRPSLKRFAVPIVSTSQGILSGRHAVSKNLGGELICEVS